MALQKLIRSAGLGKLAYRLWYRPTSRVRAIMAAGGLREVRRTELGRHEMEAAAYNLPLLTASNDAEPLQLHLLTGRRFWYQTAFCLWSFARHSERPIEPIIYDDGSLTGQHRAPLARLFPTARFLSQPEIISRLDAYLPVARFPVLRERWHNYPNIRKLTDIHIGEAGWKLVLDSDLLFFRRPTFLLDWLRKPEQPLHAVDCETSYGYPRTVMGALAGAPVADLVNVGLTGLNSSALDWEQLEFWSRKLIEQHGTHYYLEQALIAMLVAKRDCAIAPAADYVTNPSDQQSHDCEAVMQHYVATSKKAYFRLCWRVVTRDAEYVPEYSVK